VQRHVQLTAAVCSCPKVGCGSIGWTTPAFVSVHLRCPAAAGRLLVAWSVLSVTLAALSGKMGEYKGDESVY